ncbi:choloylglycine hydrolase [Shewanella sp. OPT22]|nr:choloylglycine hydrolase [Shewanella sp. OPT22]
MCTRIFNNLNAHFPVTARNMDWAVFMNTYLYRMGSGESRVGLSKQTAKIHSLPIKNILKWDSLYASISTVVGDDAQGYATVDGINEKGLVVNALSDSDSTYQSTQAMPEDAEIISALRWAQFTLDRFMTVAEAANYFRKCKLVLITENVPDTAVEKHPAQLHLCLSDPSGNSAIIELEQGQFIVHESSEYKVATNNPNYDAQLQINQYWQFLWGKSPVFNKRPVVSAPGGDSSTQNFARGSYYMSFSEPLDNIEQSISQTRFIAAACAAPLGFNPYQYSAGQMPHTIWCNVADSSRLEYYFCESQSMGQMHIDFSDSENETERVQVTTVKKGMYQPLMASGNINKKLKACSPLFED